MRRSGVAAPQKMQARHDVHACETCARRHAQNSRDMAVAAAHPLDRLVGGLDRGARPAEELDALVGEGEGPGGALQQPGTEMFLQCRDLLRDRRLADAELARHG